MTDVHDKATRSKNMRAIGTRDTAIQKRLAALLTQAGFDFRVQDPALAGRPDFVLDAWQCIIFTHGCFWHHHDCYLFKVPATRTDFWLNKIGKNVERDKRDLSMLIAQGWRVLIVWECALRGRLKLRRRSDRADRHAGYSPAYGFSTSQGVTTGFAGSKYLPSVTSTTANTMIPKAIHSTGESVSPPSPVPSSTATTGLT